MYKPPRRRIVRSWAEDTRVFTPANPLAAALAAQASRAATRIMPAKAGRAPYRRQAKHNGAYDG